MRRGSAALPQVSGRPKRGSARRVFHRRHPIARRPVLRSAREANARRNAQAPPERPLSWEGARDRLWGILDRVVPSGASVALVGAGNCDDVPLTRLTRRAGRVDLIDIDPIAPRRAARRESPRLRRRLGVRVEDATLGAADRIVAAASEAQGASVEMPPPLPLGAGRYDVVVGDLLYSQLLYPPLLDSGVPADRRGEALARHGPGLTEAVVRRLHASTGDGPVVHLHDFAGWWSRHPQPVRLERVLDDQADEALRHPLKSPLGCDPRDGLRQIGAQIIETDVWRWPFCGGVDYVVCATVAVDRGPPARDRPPSRA